MDHLPVEAVGENTVKHGDGSFEGNRPGWGETEHTALIQGSLRVWNELRKKLTGWTGTLKVPLGPAWLERLPS